VTAWSNGILYVTTILSLLHFRSSKISLNILLACKASPRSYTTIRKFFVAPPLTRIILILWDKYDGRWVLEGEILDEECGLELEDEDIDDFDDIE
jgi:hypothetical protein